MTATRQLSPRKRDKKKRPRLTERKVIEVLIAQGAIIPCGICRLAFDKVSVKYIERDHERAEHSIPDEDLDEVFADLRLQRYVHGRLDPNHDCHLAKTADDRRIKAKHDRIKGITGQAPKRKIASAGFRGWRDMKGHPVYAKDRT
jgi:hypothetical protein